MNLSAFETALQAEHISLHKDRSGYICVSMPQAQQ